MTIFQIEVRARSEQHDTQAHRLAREIIHLPLKQLPSLNTIVAIQKHPLSIRTAQLYLLSGKLFPANVDQLITNLLVDPVVQEAHISNDAVLHHHVIDVFYHAGVTDPLAESVLTGAQILGLTGLEQVETGQRYILDSRLSETDVRAITEALLYNPVIQQYELRLANTHNAQFITPTEPVAMTTPVGADLSCPPPIDRPSLDVPQSHRSPVGADLSCPPPIDRPSPHFHHPETVGAQFIAPSNAAETPYPQITSSIPIRNMTARQLLELSQKGLLALNLEEMQTIQSYFQDQQREPTDVELETLAQTWSEHCSHKTFKASIVYREVDNHGNILAEETINGLLKHYLMRATEQVKQEWLVSAFSDNAGIIRFTDTHDIAFKVETHNHPSAIEPFGGANTGVGGVIRDILGVSAQPVACTDILCFGPLDTSVDELPPGILSPRRIASGVVDGVRDYGNKMGIPTVNGAILYHQGYLYNPLVFCGCLGILPHDRHPRQVQLGDLIVVLGGRTGRDGLHGATFSSGEMSKEINAQAGIAVQIGAPITEKKVADVIIQARDLGLYHAITDCGAGGFSSAIGEMGAETGAYIELEKAPLKYQGLAPWEIWLSEAQERMVLAVPPGSLAALLEICEIEEVEASIIGSFTGNHQLIVTYLGKTVAHLEMEFLHDGRPDRKLEAVWTRREQKHTRDISSRNLAYMRDDSGAAHYASTLLALLSHPIIASKEAVIRRYDHEVQGATVLKPLVGRAGNGPGDAAVLLPFLDVGTPLSAPLRAQFIASPQRAGIVLSNGVNPLYGQIDPYYMAMNAIDEALRNLTAVGGDIARAAILDNFCWGNPTDPVQLGMLVRAVRGCHDAAIGFGTPFISGKDSLNNEYRAGEQRLPVIPTLVISAVGIIDDAAQTVDMSLKAPGNQLYLIGRTNEEMAGSYYAEVVGRAVFEQLFPDAMVPRVDTSHACEIMKAVGAAIRAGLVCSCHDLSEGGLAVALAEMAIAGSLGVQVDLGNPDPVDIQRNLANIVRLFSESASRFIVEVTPAHREAFEQYMYSSGVRDIKHIGTVTNTGYFHIHDRDELIYLPVSELQKAWKGDQA